MPECWEVRILSAITVVISLPLLAACQSERDREMFAGAQWWWDLSLGLKYPHGWHPQGVEVQNGRLILSLHGPAMAAVQTHKAAVDLQSYCPASNSYLWELTGPATDTRLVLKRDGKPDLRIKCPSQAQLAEAK